MQLPSRPLRRVSVIASRPGARSRICNASFVSSTIRRSCQIDIDTQLEGSCLMRHVGITIGLVLLACKSLPAQGVSNGPRGTKFHGFGEVNGQKTVDFWADNEKQNTEGSLHLQIELIRGVCNLTDAEEAKLRLAAKGVISRRIASGRAQLTKFIVDSELVEKAPEGTRIEENPQNKLRAFGATQLPDGVVYLSTEFEVPATEDPLWTKILESTLSEEQLRLLNEHYIQRNETFLQTAITLSIADLDQRIFLSDEQKKQMSQYFFELFENQVTPLMPMTVTQARNIVRPAFRDLSHFKDQLRPSQFNRLSALRNQPRASMGWGSPSR